LRKILAVYDEDILYAERFAREVNRKPHIPFEAAAFRTLEGLKKFAAASPVEVLMVSAETDRRVVREIRAAKTVYLADGKSAAGDGDVFCIYKYQSSANIIRELMDRYSETEENPAREGIRGMARIYGIYSPLGQCGKTSLAVTVGRILAGEAPTLLLNLEEFSGFGALSGEEYRSDLSDLLYYFSSGEYSSARLAAVVHTMNGLDYVPPVHFPEDLDLAKAGELPGLIRRIAAESAYRNLVIDVGRSRKITAAILGECDAVFMPERKDPVSQAKIAEFDQYLEDSGNGRIAGKIRKITLPGTARLSGRGYFDQLLWTEMGRYARGLLMRERGQLPPEAELSPGEEEAELRGREAEYRSGETGAGRFPRRAEKGRRSREQEAVI
jgi:hypothetical protein